MPVIGRLLPLFKLGQRVEAEALLRLAGLHDGCDELLEEGEAKQRGPVVVDEVDQQALFFVIIIISAMDLFCLLTTPCFQLLCDGARA